jgi:hypothetical protein
MFLEEHTTQQMEDV